MAGVSSPVATKSSRGYLEGWRLEFNNLSVAPNADFRSPLVAVFRLRHQRTSGSHCSIPTITLSRPDSAGISSNSNLDIRHRSNAERCAASPSRFCAICFRRADRGEVKVLLVASRRTGRWGLPKGHVESSETSRSTAEREAFEEAGVKGAVSPEVFGSFT
ncbi:NUDIX hydrolase [Rhizobium jaguaris]|uniref:NUDIX domain-containing protein n=1 Tax=Rhizobium jaguaris TaxID=1312183 RepID=A0A387G9M0_9HYPH|nr:NUDIX domain-containing protein [Rhizobium jaguaris]AYG64512.1 NUDIX domain-containing protein [Rhizobium jaguaris]